MTSIRYATNAISIRSLSKSDIEPLIKIAHNRLNIQSLVYEIPVKYDWCDWDDNLKNAYYALGGDYPDDEGVDNALSYASDCLKKVSDTIYKLSHEDLKKCISDMEKLLKKLN